MPRKVKYPSRTATVSGKNRCVLIGALAVDSWSQVSGLLVGGAATGKDRPLSASRHLRLDREQSAALGSDSMRTAGSRFYKGRYMTKMTRKAGVSQAASLLPVTAGFVVICAAIVAIRGDGFERVCGTIFADFT